MMNLNLNTTYKRLSFILIISIMLSLLLEVYLTLLENSSTFYLLSTIEGIKTIPLYFSIKQFLLIFIVFLIITYILSDSDLKIKSLTFLYKYRFLIGIFILFIGVIFQIHGSSLSKLYLSGNEHNPLLGISRFIKGDEFSVSTPFALSQYMNDFGYYSEILRATTTDMFILYGQPVWDIAVLLRPFHLGYLFMPSGYGLSFYWLSRLICLFLVSFEFGMILTRKNKTLSLAYTFLITFSPIVQWWFGVNFLVEMLIFGQLAICLINYYMNTENYLYRLICSLGMVICVGGYLFSMYPAWQIPLAYVFLAFFIWIVYENKANFKFDMKKDGFLILIFLLIAISLISYVLFKSSDAIITQLNTVYPGLRVYNGGADGYWLSGDIWLLFDYMRTIFYPLTAEELGVKISLAYFISFFPMGTLLYLYTTIKQKKRDLLINLLFIVYIGLIIYYIFTFPAIVGKLTLLNKSISLRMLLIITLIEILLLLRAMTIMDKIKFPKFSATFKNSILKGFSKFSLLLGFLIAGIVLLIGFSHMGTRFYTKLMILIALFIFGIAFFFILNSGCNKKAQKGFLICVLFISLSAGAFANPIDVGTDYYYDQPAIQEISAIVQKDPNATWVVEGHELLINSILPTGAHTLNSVNTYPNLELWSILDPDNQHEEVWNRYAHLKIVFQDSYPTVIEVPTALGNTSDHVVLTLNVNDMEKLNITYILTQKNLEPLSNENVTFTKIYSEKNLFIYKTTYN